MRHVPKIYGFGTSEVGECFANVGQQCLQPKFSGTSAPKFLGIDTQLTAAVAADHVANEHAVKIAKIDKFVSEGYRQTIGVDQLCDAWLAWGYQVNFVYKPVI